MARDPLTVTGWLPGESQNSFITQQFHAEPTHFDSADLHDPLIGTFSSRRGELLKELGCEPLKLADCELL